MKIKKILAAIGIIFGVYIIIQTLFFHRCLSVKPLPKNMPHLYKLEKLGTALSVYYSIHESIPGKNSDGKFIPAKAMQDLIDEKLLNQRDFILMEEPYIYIIISGCKKAELDNETAYWEDTPLSHENNICVSTANKPMPENTAPISTELLIACKIETILDDRNLLSMDGMLLNTAAADNITINFDQCAEYKSKEFADKKIPYVYRVF